jgi:polyisoprenoid-binding protein YceI
MKTLRLLIGLSGFLLAHSVLADDFVIDKVHSTLGFEIRHLVSKVTGKFDDFSGTINYDEAKPEKSSVTVTIQTKSIDTSNDSRDTHLKSPDFFDVAKFPEASFESTSVKKTGDGVFDVTGKFTMHGVTKEVALKVEFLGKGPGPQGAIVSGWEATTSFKRSEFGLTWNKLVEGTQLLADDVAIVLKVEADLRK